LDQRTITLDVEINTETVECLLHALVSRRMRQEKDLMAKVAMVSHEEAAPMEEQPIVLAPGRRQLARIKALAQILGIRGSAGSPTDVIDEGEGRPGADAHDSACGGDVVRNLLSVTTGEGFDDRVEKARTVLDGEIEAEELVDPLVLRNGGEPLVWQELQVVVIRANMESSPPEIGPPMAHGLDQPDELVLVRRDLLMTSSERAAEEGQRPFTLV
jgi:hypothetical protein